MKTFNKTAKKCGDELKQNYEFFGERRRKRKLKWDGTTLKTVRSVRDGGGGLRTEESDRIGFAYCNLSELDVKWLSRQAKNNLQLLPSDPDRQITTASADDRFVETWRDPTVQTELEPRKEKLHQHIKQILDEKSVLENVQVEYEERSEHFELYRSGERIGGERRSRFSMSTWAICESNDDVQSGYQHQTSFSYDDIKPRSVLEEAVNEGQRKLGASPPESRSGPVLLNPRAASSLLRLVTRMVDGVAVAKSRSAWDVGTLGEKVADEKVTLIDDPGRPAGAANCFYDSEGHRIRPATIIEDGVFQAFLTNQYVSNRLEVDNNYRATRRYSSRPKVGSTNFFVEPGETNHATLEEQLGTGPVITTIQPGSGLDPVAGEFSVGASGYFVRNGTQHEPFDEGTLSGSIEDLLEGVEAIGSNLPRGYSVASPSLLVRTLSLGGNE